MASTTLTTFLLNTPPTTNSVKLLGSWDNFTNQYAMERDRRVDPGQWKGCHTFSNIVCDGRSSNPSQKRAGGLKMGGTYWYYYLLDGSVEFYNEKEPVTTQCPFRPGQTVNVLQLPVLLPDSRHKRRRRGSNASFEKSEFGHFTMNPADKYLRPKIPSKPKLRIQTSSRRDQRFGQLWPFGSDVSSWGEVMSGSISQPAHSTRRTSGCDCCDGARPGSQPRLNDVRAAFRRLNGHAQRSDPVHGNGAKRSRRNDSKHNHDSTLPAKDDTGDKALPQQPTCGKSDGKTPVPMQDDQDPSPKRKHRLLKNFLILISPSKASASSQKPTSRKSKHLKQSPARAPVSPGREQTPKPPSSKDKRLPSLPNSPSSVMDEAVRVIDAQYNPSGKDGLYTRFSNFRSSSRSTMNNLPYEKSRFSDWGTDTETISPDSMVSSSTLNNNKNQVPSASEDISGQVAPNLTFKSRPSSPKPVQDNIKPSHFSAPRLSLTLCSPYLDIPGITTEELGFDNVKSNPKRHAALFDTIKPLSELGLPRNSDASSAFVLHENQLVTA